MTTTTTTLQADLSGQVALVTGGGRGIGRVFAQTLAAAGAAVAVLARSPDQIADTVRHIDGMGGRALGCAADVTDKQAVMLAVERIQEHLGPVEVLVNNAGVWGPLAPLWEVDPQHWWQTLEINVLGSLLCTQAVLPAMIARGRGRIINIASHAGIFRWPQASAYAVSKAALIKLSENLAAETKQQGVAVFAFHPGIVTIGLTDAALAMDAPAGSPAAWIQQEVAAGRVLPPEPGAAALVYLASGQADTLSGRYLTVHDDLAALVARAEEIRQDDLYTLRLRQHA